MGIVKPGSGRPLRPAQVVLFTVAVSGVLWTLAPYFANRTLPLDIVTDSMSFGHDFQWGYFKHPPLVFWIERISHDLLGDFGLYLLSQIFVGATVWLVFELGRRIFDETRAAFGALLLYGLFFFSWPTSEFNHNVAEMPIWAGAALLLHRCCRQSRPADWLLLGVVVGVGFLTKYVIAVFALAAAIYILSSARGRRTLATPWPYASVLVAALVVSPHVYWLTRHDFLPLHYLGDRMAAVTGVLGRIASAGGFLAAQLAYHLGMVAMVLAAALFGAISFQRAGVADPEDTAFLLTIGLGPAALCCLLPLLDGVAVRAKWAAPMWNLSGLIIVNHVVPRLKGGAAWRRLAIAGIGLMVAVAVGYGVFERFGERLSKTPARTAWPDRALAADLQARWAETTACPLRIVVGDNWLAGLVALRSKDHPQVLIDGNYQFSPWITGDRLSRQGALVIWELPARGAPRANLPAPFDLAPRGVVVEAWPNADKSPPPRIAWATLPPARRCGP